MPDKSDLQQCVLFVRTSTKLPCGKYIIIIKKKIPVIRSQIFLKKKKRLQKSNGPPPPKKTPSKTLAKKYVDHKYWYIVTVTVWWLEFTSTNANPLPKKVN